jgi:hypothetical protein
MLSERQKTWALSLKRRRFCLSKGLPFTFQKGYLYHAKGIPFDIQKGWLLNRGWKPDSTRLHATLIFISKQYVIILFLAGPAEPFTARKLAISPRKSSKSDFLSFCVLVRITFWFTFYSKWLKVTLLCCLGQGATWSWGPHASLWYIN